MISTENILDDEDIQNVARFAIKSELQRLSFWLRLAGSLLILFGIVIIVIVVAELPYSDYTILILLLFVLAILGLGNNNLLIAKETKQVISTESTSDWEQIFRKKRNNWRWITLLFFMIGIPVMTITIFTVYDDYRWERYDAIPPMDIPVEETPAEFPPQEAPVDIPMTD